MKPMGDIVIVTKIVKESLIELPEGAEHDSETFRVLECGPGHYEFGEFVPMPLKKGDIIFMVGKVANFKDGDKKYTFARARDVIAVM